MSAVSGSGRVSMWVCTVAALTVHPYVWGRSIWMCVCAGCGSVLQRKGAAPPPRTLQGLPSYSTCGCTTIKIAKKQHKRNSGQKWPQNGLEVVSCCVPMHVCVGEYSTVSAYACCTVNAYIRYVRSSVGVCLRVCMCVCVCSGLREGVSLEGCMLSLFADRSAAAECTTSLTSSAVLMAASVPGYCHPFLLDAVEWQWQQIALCYLPSCFAVLNSLPLQHLLHLVSCVFIMSAGIFNAVACYAWRDDVCLG